MKVVKLAVAFFLLAAALLLAAIPLAMPGTAENTWAKELWPEVGSNTVPEGTPNYQPQMSEARAINVDVAGWLALPGTEISGPVLQTTDNEYYLRRDITRQYSEWGSYFADYECNLSSVENLSRITVLFGHSLGDDPQQAHFSQIKNYSDPEFCMAHPFIEFQLWHHPSLRWQVFAAGVVPATLEYLNPAPTDEEYTALMETIRGASDNSFEDVTVGREDKVLILSTCTADPRYRYIVVAKLITVN